MYVRKVTRNEIHDEENDAWDEELILVRRREMPCIYNRLAHLNELRCEFSHQSHFQYKLEEKKKE